MVAHDARCLGGEVRPGPQGQPLAEQVEAARLQLQALGGVQHEVGHTAGGGRRHGDWRRHVARLQMQLSTSCFLMQVTYHDR